MGRTVSEATVRKYRTRHRNPPPQTRRTSLDNHLTDFADAEFMLGALWLAFVLPTVLTIAVLVWAYRFVQDNIASPINGGIREIVLQISQYPQVSEEDELSLEARTDPSEIDSWRKSGNYNEIRTLETRRAVLNRRWQTYAKGRRVLTCKRTW